MTLNQELQSIDCQLSPENLFQDGERPRAQAMVIARKLEKRRNEVVKLLKIERAELQREYLVEQGKIDFNG